MDTVSPLACQRALFDLPADVAYLNAASKSIVPLAAAEAGRAGVDRKARPWEIDEPGRYVEADEARALFAGLIGASAADIAIQPSAAYGIATAAQNLPLASGKDILVIEGQFPSNFYAWRNLATATGNSIRVVPKPTDGDWTPGVLAKLDGTVGIAALPPCHWSEGTLLDLEPVAARCREVGAAFVVDATQWAGVIPMDVRALGVDFLVCAAYKWLLGPYRLSFMYAAPHRQDGRPLEEHLFNHDGAAAIETGSGYADAFTPGATRYDSGEYLDLMAIPMIVASLRLVAEWRPGRIADYIRPITERIVAGAAEMGLTVGDAAHRAPHIAAIRRTGGFPSDILARLARDGVYVSARGGGLRVSPYLYNDLDDAERLLAALRQHLS